MNFKRILLFLFVALCVTITCAVQSEAVWQFFHLPKTQTWGDYVDEYNYNHYLDDKYEMEE
jgi:hypothetical protein